MNIKKCPFSIGDVVLFSPGKRTYEHYQNVEGFGVKIGQSKAIKKISQGMYIYFERGKGGFHWTEYRLVKKRKARQRRAR